MSLSIAVYFLAFGKRTRLLYSFVYCQILVLIWSIGNMFDITAKKLETKWLAVCFENFSICFIGFAWLLFAFLFTGSSIPDRKRNIIILLTGPFILYLIALTNNYHKTYYSVFELQEVKFGIFFWIHCFLSYIYLMVGTVLIIKHSLKRLGHERKQSILIVIAAMIPIFSNVVQLLKLSDLGYDITPISFSAMMFLFALATFRFKFLNVMPVALRKAFDTVEGAIVFIDNAGLIIDYNYAFHNFFIDFTYRKSIEDFICFIKSRMITDKDSKELLKAIKTGVDRPVSGEIRLEKPKNIIFRVSVQPVKGKIGNVVGYVISFIDITQYRDLVAKLEKKNNELAHSNAMLKLYAMTVEELAVEKERNRVAQDMHDSLGHKLNLLIKMQEAAIYACGKNNEKTLEIIKKSNDIAVQSLKELRMSIYNTMQEKLDLCTFLEDLNNLVTSFKSLGVDVKVIVKGNELSSSFIYLKEVFRTCQEAVTNSIKHGRADEIHIMLRFYKEGISLLIIDNGRGCKEISKGCGLLGMEERVKKLGGSITFGSDGKSRFNIHIEIPFEVKKHD